MPIELRTRDDLSVNDIVRLAREHHVAATPHVGNWTPARLVLPTLGISVLCVDHTMGSKDRNAHPQLLIQNGVAREVCDQHDCLTTHAKVTTACIHPLGTSLSEVHMGAVRALYPSADVVTHLEHLKKSKEVTLAVLEEVTTLSRSATWWRKVDAEGSVTSYRRKELPSTWAEVEPHIFPLTNEREGWLVHNRVAILMDVIQQSHMGNDPEIYHLSGPDMVRYLGSEMEILSRMYDHVRTRLGFKQETIIFNLIPFASFRFATRATQATACEKLCEELAGNIPCERSIQSSVREAFDVFAESETQDYFTQHDCLATGERIEVPGIAREWSMKTCAEHMARVRALA